MIPGRTSIIIPARQEPYLRPTVEDCLRQARGDVEVVVVLDGWWPEPTLPEDPRIAVLHWGTAQGLRQSINAGMAMATGEYVMKLDAHCAVGEGFDVTLKASCGEQDIVVPEKYSLIPETWERCKHPWQYFYLSWPWEENGLTWGLHEKNYGPSVNYARRRIPVDDILTFQGSAWLLRRTYWDRIGPMNVERYYFAHEAVELGMRAWLGGGRCRIVKAAWYAHLYKGKAHRRGFSRHKQRWNAAIAESTIYWMTDQWPERVHDFAWLVDKFGPLPGWPENWQAEFLERRAA